MLFRGGTPPAHWLLSPARPAAQEQQSKLDDERLREEDDRLRPVVGEWVPGSESHHWIRVVGSSPKDSGMKSFKRTSEKQARESSGPSCSILQKDLINTWVKENHIHI